LHSQRSGMRFCSAGGVAKPARRNVETFASRVMTGSTSACAAATPSDERRSTTPHLGTAATKSKPAARRGRKASGLSTKR
jgi:hypothetical protein